MTADIPEWAQGIVSPLDDKLGIVFERLSPHDTRGRMPVAGNTQLAGILHGGASCVLAEGLGSLAAFSYGRERGLIPVGVDINATHHRAAHDGWVHGVATPAYLGGRTVTYDVVISNDAGERVCTARITCQLIGAPTAPSAGAATS